VGNEKNKAIRTGKETTSGFCLKCGAWYGQLGLEPTIDMYIEHLLEITKELKRVLKPTGVMFWNHADCYSGSGKGYGSIDPKYPSARDTRNTIRPNRLKINIPQKCLCLQNYRLILRMVDEQGWILRNQCPWIKPNAMPESVEDRFARKWEPVFMLTKNNKPQYYYNIKTGLMADRKPPENKQVEGIDWGWEEVGIVNENTFNVRVRDADKGRFMEGATEEEKRNYGKPKLKKVSYWKSLDYWFDLDAVRVPHKESTIQRAMYPVNAFGGDPNNLLGKLGKGKRFGLSQLNHFLRPIMQYFLRN